jgi:putative heme iron utilization protein
MRTTLKGALATLESDGGHPYASLVLIATDADATPLLLISRLARHTRNLEKDARASLLLERTEGLPDPLSGGRLTLSGEARPTDSPSARRRFLARHPAAAVYAGFPDFVLYALSVRGGHYIGGFGTIIDWPAAALLTPTLAAAELMAAEAHILDHMNAEHAEAVALYATELAGEAPGAWRLSGIDPDGADLLHRTSAARITFPCPVRTPNEAREQLAALARDARARRAARG